MIKRLINKFAESIKKGKEKDKERVKAKLDATVENLKESRKQIIFAINQTRDNETRKKLNQTLNKIDAQLRVL
jgi:uncharacterized caspase-like protein